MLINEIEKLYQNAKVKPVCDGLDCFTCIAECNNGKYPEFTAKKQLKLLRFLTKLDLYSEIVLRHTYDNKLGIEIRVSDPGVTLEDEKRNTIGEAIVAVINQRWEFLTEEERQQVKEILEHE